MSYHLRLELSDGTGHTIRFADWNVLTARATRYLMMDTVRLAIVTKKGEFSKAVSLTLDEAADIVVREHTDEWAFMETCATCNNDHHFITVLLGECPYESALGY